MSDNTRIERTIFKLEIDGSAYVEGADKLTASTNKLSQAQEAANKKLIELQAQEKNLKKELEEVDIVIKANEKETLALTKDLNLLKEAGKGASAEAKSLQAQLRGVSTSTKEFKIESAALKTNITTTTTAIKDQVKQVAALEPATGGAAKGFSKVYTTLQKVANIIPGLGISGLLLLIAGPLVDALTEWAEKQFDVNEEQKRLTEILDRSSDSYGKAVVEINDMTTKIDLAKKGFLSKSEVLKEYNDTIGRTIGKTNDLDKAEQLLIQHGPDYIKLLTLKAQAQAAGELAAESAKKRLIDENTGFSFLQNILLTTAAAGQVIDSKAKELNDDTKNTEAYLKKQQDLLKEAAEFAKVHQLNFFPTPTGKEAKVAVNIYQQELQKLKADIAKLDEKSFTNETSITKAIEEDFKIRNDAFDKAFKNKQLTAQQLASLQGYLKNLQELTLNAQLKSFREQKQAYLTAISDEITALQLEEGAKRIQALQDSFERERQTIILEADKSVTALKERTDKRITSISSDVRLTQPEKDKFIQEIKDVYEKLLDDIQIIKNQKLQQLSFETFEALTEDAKRALDAENLGISQGSLFRIREQAALFQQGKISFEQYQKALTEIARGEAQERFNVEVAFLRQEIKLRQDKLAIDKDLTDAQIKKLKDEIRKLEQQLADAEKGNIIAENNAPDKKKKTDTLVAYADSIGKLVDSVVQFWQSANEAEQKALDRSISLQEKRVDAAQRIADRGNAQYLKNEVDKLNELNVARENAARKQLGIDAALQASQILVGITGAISKIAVPGIGAAETIAEIAIIIGALATGYGLVKSLQNNQPRLYKGTKYLKRDGHPEGVDTIPAMLTEGEAVIPKDNNKEYKETVAAVYDKSVPARDLNEFVKTYHTIKPVVQANYERIREVTELKISQDGKMSVVLAEQNELLKENTELQKQTLKAIRAIRLSVNMDKHGLVVSFLEAAKQIEINKNL